MKKLLLLLLLPLTLFAGDLDRFNETVNGIDVWRCWVEIPTGLLSSAIPRSALAYLHGEHTDEETGEKSIYRYRTEMVDYEVEVTDEEGNVTTVTRQKKQKVRQDITKVELADFTLQHTPSKNLGKTIIMIGACLGDRYRVYAVTEADVYMWLEYLLPHGFGEDDLLDKEEMRALLPEVEQ